MQAYFTTPSAWKFSRLSQQQEQTKWRHLGWEINLFPPKFFLIKRNQSWSKQHGVRKNIAVKSSIFRNTSAKVNETRKLFNNWEGDFTAIELNEGRRLHEL